MGRFGGAVGLDGTRKGRFMLKSSAEKTAFARALGAIDREPQLRNPDFMAREFLADLPTARVGLRMAARIPPLYTACRWGLTRVTPGAYWGEIARVKHFDEILLEQASAGVGQLVVLGAGLDSRPYRFASELSDVRVFEVDHPVTAARKRECLQRIFGQPPAGVSYVSADLTEQSPAEPLAASGFDPAAPVLVLWIGVAMYLPAESVEDVLRWVAGHPRGSSIGFDYYDRAFYRRRGRRMRGARRARFLVERSGERFLSGFDPEALPAFLGNCGLAVKSHLRAPDQEVMYLRRPNGDIAGRPIEFANFVHAEVAPS